MSKLRNSPQRLYVETALIRILDLRSLDQLMYHSTGEEFYARELLFYYLTKKLNYSCTDVANNYPRSPNGTRTKMSVNVAANKLQEAITGTAPDQRAIGIIKQIDQLLQTINN